MRLHDTLTKQIKTVTPQVDDLITVYSCGPTVYDYPHIGNWFAFIRWDTLVRILKTEYRVNWVMNITDVGHLVSDDDTGEDKLEKGAKREHKTAWETADFYSNYFLDALNKLNFSDINHVPKATEHIEEQIELIKLLESKGYTYTINDGVYFDTSKLKDYGKLTNLNNQDLLAGARVEPVPGKKNITDFALWKFSPAGVNRDMEWESPWGIGFPGWHIECSAMSMKYLGQTIDIHCGGIDHIPIHHTNEIAQSESITGKQLANIWIHTNHIKINGKKISKSLGNIITLEDIQKKGFSLQAFRLLVLESHYSREAQFTWQILSAANNRLKNWQSVADLALQPNAFLPSERININTDYYKKSSTKLLSALRDNLNTPEALSIVDETFSYADDQGLNSQNLVDFNNFIKSLDSLLGIKLNKDPITTNQQNLLDKRHEARQRGNWKESDEIRKKLHDSGLIVKDTANGQIWQRV